MINLTTYLDAGTTNLSNLILNNYAQLGLTDGEILLYIQLECYQQSGDYFPDMTIISEKINKPIELTYQLLQSLIDKKIVALSSKKTADGKNSDYYDLRPILNHLDKLIDKQMRLENNKNTELARKDLFQAIEMEFGRPLSPIEYDTIRMWLDEDHYAIELINLALREAVLNQAYSLKYMDRILLSWERKNIHTKEQVIDQTKLRKSKIQGNPQIENEQLPKVPLYNWMNPENK